MPETDNRYVANVRDAEWLTSETDEPKRSSGADCTFDGAQYAVRLHVLQPGEPNGLYHAESAQEDFLVLSGECKLLVEGEERQLRRWDFFHSPPGTEHIFVGAGEGACVILMIGAHPEEHTIRYPVSDLAARYGASVDAETTDPDDAYTATNFALSRRARPSYWDELPWG